MSRPILLLAALATALLLLTGCADEVSMAPPSDRPFSVWGTLNPMSDTQWVFVYPVQRHLNDLGAGTLDAVLTTTDNQTGETRVWRDSVMQDWRKNTVHAFYSAFMPAYGHEYTLRIERSDGNVSQARTRIPQPGSIQMEDPIQGTYTNWSPVILKTSANYLLKVEVLYDVTVSLPGIQPLRLVIPLPYRDRQRVPLGWRIPIDLTQNRLDIHLMFAPETAPLTVAIHKMQFRAVVANEEWYPPNGEFDHEVLVDPNVMTNVENGYGFFTAGYALENTWLPPAEFLTGAGFIVVPDLPDSTAQKTHF